MVYTRVHAHYENYGPFKSFENKSPKCLNAFLLVLPGHGSSSSSPSLLAMELFFPAPHATFSTSSPCIRLISTYRRLPFSKLGSSQVLASPLRRSLRLDSLNPRPTTDSSSCLLRGKYIGRASMAFSDSVLLHDLGMGVVTLAGAMTSLKFWDELAKRNVFSTIVSRKLVHISIGMIFMLFWPLFSDSVWAPYIAAFSAAVNGLRMLAIGYGIIKDPIVVKAMTRGGDYRELLKGPFYYAVTITLATTCFWRISPVAPIVIANLCAGDGFADLVGRKFGKVKLPYNQSKSYVGSLAMLFFGFLFSMMYHYYFSSFGFYTLSSKLVLTTFLVALATTVVESLPISTQLDDNLTVPFTSFVVGVLLV